MYVCVLIGADKFLCSRYHDSGMFIMVKMFSSLGILLYLYVQLFSSNLVLVLEGCMIRVVLVPNYQNIYQFIIVIVLIGFLVFLCAYYYRD